MIIGVFRPDRMPTSILSYYMHIRRELENNFDCKFVEFQRPRELSKDMDLVWDPRGGRGAPPPWLGRSFAPIVATYHGAVHLALPLHESIGLNPIKMLNAIQERKKTLEGWKRLFVSNLHVIAVSQYAKDEFQHHFKVKEEYAHFIYHGVQHELFNGVGRARSEKYILHVSSYQPKKNVDKIISAYKRLKMENKPRLIVISPGLDKKYCGEGVDIVTEQKSHEELSEYYINALAFVFPSLHETFGLPILEAMSSGCPVITSNSTACCEIADSAAILVNPRCVSELSKALNRVIKSNQLRESLREKGFKRSQMFNWEKSAHEHYDLFKDIIRKEYNKYFWDDRYRECPEIGSGPGSRGYAKWLKGNLIAEVVRKYNVADVIDIGCGDMEVIKSSTVRLHNYIGLDIAPQIVEKNCKLGFGFSTNIQFFVHDISSSAFKCNKQDLVICLDVLIHQLREEDFYNSLANIFAIESKYYLLSYQDKDGAVTSDLPDGIPENVITDEIVFREKDREYTELKRAEVTWFGEFEKILESIEENFVVKKIGCYRGQSVFLIYRNDR